MKPNLKPNTILLGGCAKEEATISASAHAPRRPGHQHKPVIGFDGQPVTNLSSVAFEYKKDGDGKLVLDEAGNKIVLRYRYFATTSKPRIWLGFDLKEAIRRLRAWEAQQNGRHIILAKSEKLREPLTEEERKRRGLVADGPDEEQLKRLERELPAPYLHTGALTNETWLSEDRRSIIDYEAMSLDDVFAAMRRVLDDPELRKLAAEATGYPLDRLDTLPEPRQSPTLSSLLALFQEKATVTPDWRGKVKQFWNEFTASVKVATVRELTREHITGYYDQTIAQGKSPTYSSQRFGAIKRVFNFARVRGVSPTEMRNLLDYCAVLQPPRAKGHDPCPISREDFQKLLRAADPMWKAILLSALNFCMYGIEVSRIRKCEIDLKRKTLVTKTGCTRVAVLWDATVKAIRALPKAGEEYVFISREGGPYDAEGIRTAFSKLRKQAGVAETVKFSHIRDGAYTAAIEGGADLMHAKLLAGHATGISDAYVRRKPTMVQDACEAVERFYLGKNARRERK